MKLTLSLTALFFFTINISGQVANWENYSVPSEGYIKNSGEANAFESEGIKVVNNYVDDPQFPYWSGWILSSGSDVTTEGFTNEHSAIAGMGADNSSNYLVTYPAGGQSIIKYAAYPQNIQAFKEISITNNTYAYFSILNGDGFAKKFGGESGDDPDFYLLTIKGYKNGILSIDSIDFYLADYRFNDNSKDYIVDTWEVINVELFKEADSLALSLSSSDNGAFGMNTPGYICVDNITTSMATNSVDIELKTTFEISITNGGLINFICSKSGKILITDLSGKAIQIIEVNEPLTQWDNLNLQNGLYFATFFTETSMISKKIVIH